MRSFSAAVMSLPDAPGTNVFDDAVERSRASLVEAASAVDAVVLAAESVVASDVGSLSGVRNSCLAAFRSYEGETVFVLLS